MRRFLRFAAMVLALLAIAMISAVTTMRYAIHGREVFVPKFENMPVAQAQRMASDNGLILVVEDRYFSATVRDGAVIVQLPAAGVRVRRGSRVRVAQSLGPQRAEVPDLIGQSGRAAEINIQRRGLAVGTVAIANIPGASPGQVIAQTPPPRSTGATEPKVSVLVAAAESAQQFLMPDFVGRHLADVMEPIQNAGFKVGKVQWVGAPVAPPNGQPVDEKKMGSTIIVKQSPAAGARIAGGAEIFFEATQ
ncbi:MAG: PASTA domain-containing protein [Acidobacteriales bacterium]|nr:PASTA domain-containing protein [Terriglobales bacterium]